MFLNQSDRGDNKYALRLPSLGAATSCCVTVPSSNVILSIIDSHHGICFERKSTGRSELLPQVLQRVTDICFITSYLIRLGQHP